MKILICGFPNSGTTLLRHIIGSIDSVYEIEGEYMMASPPIYNEHVISKSTEEFAGSKHILVKCPWLYPEFFTKEFEDYIKIFIIRNPYYVFSSINKRFNYNVAENHNVPRCLKTIQQFMDYQGKLNNFYFIKYEEMFKDNFFWLRTILNSMKLQYTDDIFINKEIPLEKPLEDNQYLIKYRKWQINQPYIYADIDRPVYLTQEQLNILDNSPILKQINYSRPKNVNIV